MRRASIIGLLVLAACAGPGSRIDGVVVAVDGGLSGVASFEIVTRGGERLRFVPGDGVVAFDDGVPLSHLNEHLQTGSGVRVTYVEDNGVLVALAVSDVP
ncbi:MAG: hypothetical protein HZA58_03720 [Acidimicrobiia bacterium]|nr:hypothetical protein [Acidimicrobiia bacterium]